MARLANQNLHRNNVHNIHIVEGSIRLSVVLLLEEGEQSWSDSY